MILMALQSLKCLIFKWQNPEIFLNFQALDPKFHVTLEPKVLETSPPFMSYSHFKGECVPPVTV